MAAHRNVYFAAGLTVGLLQTWAHRYLVGVDAISYLDLAHEFARGSMLPLINGCWSPLYPAVLAVPLGLLHPSRTHDFQIVQAVNLVVFIATLWAVEALIAALKVQGARRVLAYSVALWATLGLITASQTNPDMLFMFCLVLAMLYATRVRDKTSNDEITKLADWCGLGLWLGLAYLAKSVLFPLAFVILAALWPFSGARDATKGLASAILVFLVVAAAVIVPLSLNRGRFDFGDAGRLNVLWRLNALPQVNWQGGTHPTRRVMASPATYVFGDRPGTYPPWFDPSYYFEGVPLSGRIHVAALRRNAAYLVETVFGLRGSVAVCLTLLLLGSEDQRRLWRSLWTNRLFWGPALMATILYLASHMEFRYLGPWAFLFLLGTLVTAEGLPERWLRLSAGLVSTLLLVFLAQVAVHSIADGLRAEPDVERIVESARIGPGLRLASIGRGMTDVAHVAYLADAKIVAEVDDAETFWRAPAREQQAVLEAFRRAGADEIIAKPRGPWGDVQVQGYAFARMATSVPRPAN